jgi:hypothetical protein
VNSEDKLSDLVARQNGRMLERQVKSKVRRRWSHSPSRGGPMGTGENLRL